MISWAGADSQWIDMIEPPTFVKVLDRMHQIAPKMILSAHLPLASGKKELLLDLLARVSSRPLLLPRGGRR
jgi:hypothetical protein